MAFNRRDVLKWSGAAAATAAAVPARAAPNGDPVSVLGLDATAFGVRPGSPDDQTVALQRALDQAASARTPLALPPGVYRAGGLKLAPGAQVAGVPGATRLVTTRNKPLFTAVQSDHIRLTGLIFDGGGQPLAKKLGLVMLANGIRVRVTDCDFIGSGSYGLMLDRIGGEVTGTSVIGSADVAIFSINARGLVIARNAVRRAGNNGIQIWRSEPGEDATVVTDNQIEEIAARDGGSGQNGNAINVFRAGSVIVRGNRIDNCAFSAVRGNAASNIQIGGNICSALGETALYSEFGFEGATIVNNSVDGAEAGISVTNFNQGGRLAVVQGNIVRNIAKPLEKRGEDTSVGIFVEADTVVSANVVEKATRAGIMAGWGSYLRDVSITGNVVRESAIGVAVSVVPGAGAALIANNLISGATQGAILGVDHLRPVTTDLAKDGAQRYSQLVVTGNRVN